MRSTTRLVTTASMAACLLLTADQAPAEETAARDPLVDPSVFSVVSQAWPSQRNGVIRVVSLAHGFEHVSAEVVAQWLEPDPDDERVWTIAKSQTLVTPGFLALGPPRLSVQGAVVMADLEGVHSYQPETRIQCRFALHQDRKAVVEKACGE